MSLLMYIFGAMIVLAFIGLMALCLVLIVKTIQMNLRG